MNTILKLIKRELKTKVLSKGFLVGTLLGPIFLIGIYAIPGLMMFYSEESPTVLQVVDESGQLAELLPEEFGDRLDDGQPRFIYSAIPPERYSADPERYRVAVESGEVEVLLVIPGDVLSGGQVTYMGTSVTNLDLIRLVQSRITGAVNRIRLTEAGLDPAEIARMTQRVPLRTVKVKGGGEEETGFGRELPTAFVFLMLLYVTILAYGAAVMRGVLEEKTSRILEVLLSSSNAFQLMMGKLFGVGTAGLIQYMVWIAVASAAYVAAGAATPSVTQYVDFSAATFAFFVLFFIIGYFQFSALYAAVGAACSTQEDAQALSAPVTILIIIPFMVSLSLGLSQPDESLSRTLSMVPFFAPMLMFLRIMLSNPETWEIVAAVGINVVAIVVLTWLSARIYRVGVLMYGKRPGPAELLRWMRYR